MKIPSLRSVLGLMGLGIIFSIAEIIVFWVLSIILGIGLYGLFGDILQVPFTITTIVGLGIAFAVRGALIKYINKHSPIK